MKDFYVFVDIELLLSHWRSQKKGVWYKYCKQSTIDTFDKNSLCSLNYLIDALRKEYSCHVLFNDTWRISNFELKNILEKCGFKHCDITQKLPFCRYNQDFSCEIENFFKLYNKTNNIVIVTNHYGTCAKQFGENKILTVSKLLLNAFTIDDCKNFLKTNNYLDDAVCK